MDTTTVTEHTVNIYQADFDQWLVANAGSLQLATAEIRTPVQFVSDGRALEIIFPVTQVYLDTFLRGVIPELPVWGSYTYSLISGPKGLLATVGWKT